MRILLVEDDENLCQVIREQLKKEGCVTDCCGDGEAALAYALHPEHDYDVVLLDRMLPVIDGLTVVKAMRQKQIWTPVLMITGLGQVDDRIEGLDGGADDYLVKPFHITELRARVRALARRPAEMERGRELSAFDLVLDPDRRQLCCRERCVVLTQKEADLLTVFLERPERTHSRERLLWRVWGGEAEVEAGNVDNYIHFLRKRLRELECQAGIKTVYGAGYRLEGTP
jgi:DNA-binding response OmpR family regulator